MIVNKPVWLAVGLSTDGMTGRNYETYPFLTSEHDYSKRCLVALQNKSDFRKLVVAASELPKESDISMMKSNEGDAHTTAGLLKMPVFLISSVNDNHITGWMDDIEPYL